MKVVLFCGGYGMRMRSGASDDVPKPMAMVGAARGENTDRAGLEFFETSIRPLLIENCYQCHGEKKQESGLALNSAGAMLKGGDRGPPIVAGDATETATALRGVGGGALMTIGLGTGAVMGVTTGRGR